jgi:hypothetical protein
MYIMSKAKSMYAGSSGSNYGVNKNSPGNGNGKWQGLWPSVGHTRNARYINTRAGGDNRNVVFCMNQLGGVGRISNMFATTADGVKQPCHNGLNNKSALENAIEILWHYFLKYDGNGDGIADGTLILVGAKEYLTSDNVKDPQQFQPIQHFDKQHPEYNKLPSHIQQLVDIVNRAGFSGPLKPGGPDVPHIVGWASAKTQNALLSSGFGRFISIGTRSVFMFQSYDVGPIITEPNYDPRFQAGMGDWGTEQSRLPNAPCKSGNCSNGQWEHQYDPNSFPPQAKPSKCSNSVSNPPCKNGFIIHNIWARANGQKQLTSKKNKDGGPQSTFYGSVTGTGEFTGFWDIGPNAGYSPESVWNGPNQNGTDPCTFSSSSSSSSAGWTCPNPPPK